jgi:hypothetical protein
MTDYLEHLPSPETWDDLGHALTTYPYVYVASGPVLLMYDEVTIAVLERPTAWRARHRRGLHRLGFRPRTTAVGAMWEWSPPDDDVREEVGRADNLAGLPDHAFIQFAREVLARDRLLSARCVVVLREVFALVPRNLRLIAVRDDADDWDEAI